MATVRMKCGDKYADIFDSPETIKQAQLDGFSIVEPTEPTEELETIEEPKTHSRTKPR